MNRTSAIRLFFFLIIFVSTARAQKGSKAAPPAPQQALVNVVVTDARQKPRPGEEVLFISEKDGLQVAGKTNAAGRFSFALAPGTSYAIKLKTLNDTTYYNRIEIPALEPGQYFESPFSVDITYEPTRTYTLNNVHFDTGKPTLRPDSFRELDEIAAYMKLRGEQRFEIAGHTDNTGREEDNRRLSQQRAESVKRYLVKKGISSDRILAKGYGPSKPVATNDTPEGRQKNRRTEVTFL